jgi:hypothetical protein
MPLDLSLACLSVLVEPAQRYWILDNSGAVSSSDYRIWRSVFTREARIEHPASSIKHHGAKAL